MTIVLTSKETYGLKSIYHVHTTNAVHYVSSKRVLSLLRG